MSRKNLGVFSFLIITAVILFLGKSVWDTRTEKVNTLAEEYKTEQKQIQEKEAASYSELFKSLKSKEIKEIKLIGDSITAGVGGSEYSIPEDSDIIFDNGGDEVFRESNHVSISWANSLRRYVNINFPDVELINAGIGGKSASWGISNKEQWLKNGDVVFVMLGTNDRWFGGKDEYKENITNFLEYVDQNSNQMIVMSPPPATSDKDERFTFGAKEINQILKDISKEKNYTFISHYEEFNKYMENNEIKLEELLDDSGTHPVEKGYKIMWDTIKRDLTLLDEY